MRINAKLNLVIPIYETAADQSPSGYVHAAPISTTTFEQYYLTIAKTFAGIHAEGLSLTAGPRIAAMMLKDVATRMHVWDGETGVRAGLMGEIRRLANFITGGKTVPLDDAIRQNLIGEDDVREVENALVFFTVGWSMYPTNQREALLNGAADMWNAQTSSLNCTEFAASLRTSTGDASSSAKATPLSIPL